MTERVKIVVRDWDGLWLMELKDEICVPFRNHKRRHTSRKSTHYRLETHVTNLLGTTEETSTTSSNQTDLLTRRSEARHSRSVTNVLMVTTTMGMVNGIHGHTTNLGPAVALGLVLVVSTTSLHDGLVDTTTTSDDTNGGTAIRADDLLGAGGKLDAGDAFIGIVTNDGGVVSGSASDSSTITNLFFDVANDGTFGHLTNGHDISNGQSGLATAVNELTSVHTFGGNESSRVPLVLVSVAEFDLGKGSTTTGIVDDFLDDTADVTLTFGEIQSAKFSGTLAMLGVSLEDSSVTLTLGSNDATHFCD